MEYTPPLVRGNRMQEYCDVRDTLDEKGLDIGGYIRISTAKDSQKTSIENQKKYISEWAQIRGYNLKDFYVDIKTGAYSYTRNEMSRLKNDIVLGKIQGIVSKEISRTSRDIMDIIELKRSLADKGAFFISIKEAYDSRTDDDEFLLIIYAGLAQKERKMTSSRVKITQIIKAREGKTNVPVPAFGYKLSNDRQSLVVDPGSAEIYKLITDKFLQGWGRLKICKYLNSEGIKTNRGGGWGTNSLLALLINPVYLGVTIYNATVRLRDSNGMARRMVRPREDWIIRENTHTALICQEKFDKIQQLITEKKGQEDRGWSCTKKYLLSGFLYCDSCGGKLYGGKVPKNYAKGIRKQDRKTEDYYYYYFDKKLNGRCSHKSANYPMELIEKRVFDKIRDLFSDNDMIDEIVRNKQYIYDIKMQKGKNEYQTVTDKLDAVKHAVKRQQIAFESEAITLEEYKNRLRELRSQNQKYLEILERLNKKLNKSESSEARYFYMKNRVKELINNIHNLDISLQEDIIRSFIKRINVSDEGTLEIQYTFED